jgi:hypothetical protein
MIPPIKSEAIITAIRLQPTFCSPAINYRHPTQKAIIKVSRLFAGRPNNDSNFRGCEFCVREELFFGVVRSCV